MNTHYIFFDIDGTLLDEKTHQVPKSAQRAIASAQRNGHQCIINTGRPISTIDQVIKDIPFDGYICGCGTYIHYHNQMLFHATLTQSQRQTIIKHAFECHVDVMLEGKDGVIFSPHLQHPMIRSIQKRYQNIGFSVSELQKDDDPTFDKFTVWCMIHAPTSILLKMS